MARAIVGNPFANQIPTVSPIATPVDTYVRGVVKRNPFDALVTTLSNLKRNADPVLGRIEQQAAEKEMLEGQRLYQENRIAMGDAVRQGIIEEGASPYLRKGYRISQMNTAAARYAEELEAYLIAEKPYTTGDVAGIEDYLKTFEKDFVEANGLNEFTKGEVAEYFGISAAKANDAFRASWRSKHIDYQTEEQYRAFQTEVATIVGSLIRPDMSDAEQDIAYAKAATWLQEQAKLRNVDGQDNKRVLDSIVSGVLFAAVQNKDPELVDVLLTTKIGTDAVGKSVERMKQVFDTKVTIAKLLEADSAKISEELKLAHETLAGEVSANVFANIHGPNYDPIYITNEINRLVATKDEKLIDEAVSLRTYQNTVNKLVNEQALTPELLAQADALMAQQPDRLSARTSALTFVQANGLGAADLQKMMTNWQQNFAPSGDEFGLKFNVGTTPEGALLARLKDTALGSEMSEDYANEERADTFRRVRVLAQRKIRTFVQEFKSANNNNDPTEADIEEFIFTLEGSLLTLISEDAKSKSQGLVDLTAPLTEIPNF